MRLTEPKGRDKQDMAKASGLQFSPRGSELSERTENGGIRVWQSAAALTLFPSAITLTDEVALLWQSYEAP